jgi:hypothetical protein
MGSNLEAHYKGSKVIIGLVMIECVKFDECNDWLMLGVNVPHGG